MVETCDFSGIWQAHNGGWEFVHLEQSGMCLGFGEDRRHI